MIIKQHYCSTIVQNGRNANNYIDIFPYLMYNFVAREEIA
nr:MAG TPA: hypothetical protein [Caudoviricetes sp.]